MSHKLAIVRYNGTREPEGHSQNFTFPDVTYSGGDPFYAVGINKNKKSN